MISADPEQGRPGRGRVSEIWRRIDGAAGGLAADLALYGLAAAFAGLTAVTSTLVPHRAWGAVAAVAYLLAALAVAGQLTLRHRPAAARLIGTPARATLTALAWVGAALLPLLWQSVERAGGRLDRAQEEVPVIEGSGSRLFAEGTPYLTREAILALPADERLLGYTPYQPGMALFGLPHALGGATWWTDARLWFALVTAAALLAAVAVLRRPAAATAATADTAATPGATAATADTLATPGATAATADNPITAGARRDAALVRAVQFATILPICALTLATGGDDLPVLALCLLALALCAAPPADRFGAAGLAVGAAAALKLFAWPIALVLLAHAATRGRRAAARLAAGAIGVPAAALLPPLLVDPAALTENVLRFPLGQGVVTSPAQSPLPGYLIATALPAGRTVAAALLVAAGLAIAVRLVRRPPGTAAAAAAICGYGLLAAILLMPATRFGYLLYPAALLAWVPALLPSPGPPPPRSTDPVVTPLPTNQLSAGPPS